MPTSKQRREAARRHLERQAARRQERESRRRQFTLIGTIVGVLVVFAIVITSVVMLTHDDKKTPAAAASTTASASASASTSATTAAKPGTCAYVASGTPARKVTLPLKTGVPITGTVAVEVNTSQGLMKFSLNRAAAPCTVENFVSLVTQKYYDNTSCHRLVTSGIYVLQCGDPTGTGGGGPGYTIPDEYTGKETYPAGVLAMANTGAANSGGSQFFIVYKDSTAGLGKTYTVFGTVTSGLAVVQKVAAAGSNNKNSTGDGAPKLPITIKSATITS